MRSRCDRPAQVRLTYDTLSCQVWLDALPERTGLVHEICEFHAKRITLPIGWTLSDRRSTTPRLFDLDLTVPRPPLPQVEDDKVEADASAATRHGPDGVERRQHPRTWPPKRSPRLYHGRHPSMSASELFAGHMSNGVATHADQVVDVTPSAAFTDGYMSIISAGSSSIERVILLGADDASKRRGA